MATTKKRGLPKTAKQAGKAAGSASKPFACLYCPHQTAKKKYLARHVRSMHQDSKTVQCEYCPKMFMFRSSMLEHARVHTGEQPHICKVCGKAFNSKYSLKSHNFIHTNEKPFTCDVCPYACRDSSSLRKHCDTHSGRRPVYQCRICGVKVQSKRSLKIHVAEKHLGIDVKIHQCPRCDKRFKDKSVLNNHIKSVHDKCLGATCPICDARLAQRGNLRGHMRLHAEDRAHKCPFEGCGKAYKDSSSLRKHSILHTPEKHLPCGVCGRLFTRPERRARHLLTMHGPPVKRRRPVYKHSHFECDECGFVSRNKPGLLVHIRCQHIDAKRCKLCKKTFSHHWRLRKHCSYVHGVEYKCPPSKSQQPRANTAIDIKEEVFDDAQSVDLFEIEKEEPLQDLFYEETSESEDEKEAEEIASRRVLESAICVDIEDIPETVFNKICSTDAGEDANDVLGNCDASLEDLDKNSNKKAAKGSLAENIDKAKSLDALHEDKIAVDTKNEERDLRKPNNNVEIKSKHSIGKNGVKVSQVTAKSLIEKNIRNLKGVPEAVFDEFYIQLINRKNISETKSSNHKKVDAYCPKKKIEKVKKNLIVEEKNLKRNKNTNPDDKNIRENNNNDNDETHIPKTTDLSDCINRNGLNKDGDDKSENIISGPDNVERKSKGEHTPEKEKDILKYGINEKKTIDVDSEINKSINDDVSRSSRYNTRRLRYNYKEMLNNDLSSDDEIIKSDYKKTKVSQWKPNEELDKDSTIVIPQDEGRETETSEERSRKALVNSHQCYVCFKIYESKPELMRHCAIHFDICNSVCLKKCPLCDYVSNHHLPRHMRLSHGIDIRNKYNVAQMRDSGDNSRGSRYYVEMENGPVDKIEVIPSVKNLNKRASMNIDRKNRDAKDKVIAKEKLVKKKQWVVEREKVDMENVFVPKFDSQVDSEEYMAQMRKLYFDAKKEGKLMMFPCQDCEKICQSFAALKLHRRKHDPNKKPFKPKVWKHKIKDPEKLKELQKAKEKRLDENKRNEKPKPIVHKHKCEPQLKSFYRNFIRGGDIEFWQFLKIYNKMGRENVKCFKDLEKRKDFTFGLHTPGPNDKGVTASTKRNDEDSTVAKKSAKRKNPNDTSWKNAKRQNPYETTHSKNAKRQNDNETARSKNAKSKNTNETTHSENAKNLAAKPKALDAPMLVAKATKISANTKATTGNVKIAKSPAKSSRRVSKTPMCNNVEKNTGQKRLIKLSKQEYVRRKKLKEQLRSKVASE